jgi:hypothetical protein
MQCLTNREMDVFKSLLRKLRQHVVTLW